MPHVDTDAPGVTVAAASPRGRGSQSPPSTGHGCGSAVDVCFEQIDEKDTGSFAYVGAGQGDYEQVAIMPAVELSPVPVKYELEPRARPCGGWLLLYCALCALLTGLACLLSWLILRRYQLAHSDVGQLPLPPPSPGPSFDCQAGYWNWESGWSTEKKDFCCSMQGRGCEASGGYGEASGGYGDGAQPQPDADFDCGAAYGNWQAAWSFDKKRWCCENQQRGCPETSRAYDCQSHEASWSEMKQAWCCSRLNIGCGEVITSVPYDCTAGEKNWKKGWSIPKKQWCCQEFKVGCLHDESDFDCDEGLDNWKLGWSLDKMRFCCDTQGRPEPRRALPEQLAWSTPKKDWCCSHFQRGCAPEVTTTLLPYDCYAGYENWQNGWSDSKKRWCCDRFSKGCAHVQSSAPFDCDAGVSRWERGWPVSKKRWCCVHAQRACDPYDCSDGFQDWRALWSMAKQAWCCDKEHRGCPPPTTTGPFDCSAGYANWDIDWSGAKKAWCCKNHQRACERFDCHLGFSHWQVKWPPEKQKFCCAHSGAGCPVKTTSERFDCLSGYERWEAWSAPKRHFCCAAYERACDPFDCEEGFGHWETGRRGFALRASRAAREGTGKLSRPSLGHTGMKNWQSWSNEHMLFCCKHYGLACPFDCFTGTPELWPPGQRQWCCENSRVGCGAHGQRYDCDAGFSRWQSTWTPSKKQWCCANFNRGCQETGAQGCDALCRTHLGDTSCLERVRSLAESTACREAFERVQEDCPSCGTCTLQSACEEHRWADEQLQAPEEWS
ncbi:unnamed protein product [Effrenium voratum]|nr:unnamed protein product [Effrenium voratum]